ncbi:hypothetical protein [Adhaeribacter soli]|uniref:Uncharacterized protein n=1 Tax=Adhaeribacter soli TaxID=2607655 RepID=A0A5N1IWD3_9BACT|nr:hypothetical protein [Adhaeribacter soli]KAA9338825.1 hypothetical protein F0P94_08510 [Adhaeribacter soli]
MKILSILLVFTSYLSFGQSFKSDLKEGLYSSSPDWIIVRQLTSDTLQMYKLLETKEHFNKVALVLFDFVPEIQNINKRRNRATKVDEFIVINDHRFALVFGRDSLFNILNFLKKDTGYEYYGSSYKVKRNLLVESIRKDTTDYFTFSAFTIADLKKIKKLKPLSAINEEEFNIVLNILKNREEKYFKQIENNESRSMYGTVEIHEILVKILLELGYNPILKIGEFDQIYKKYKPEK